MKYKVTHDGITKTYAAIFHTAWHLLESARNRAEGSLLNLQAASVFFAFSFEAYLNHVGAEEIVYWEEIDRISYYKKLRILCKQLAVKQDDKKPPFKTIKELFDLRNQLAHGRTVLIDVSYETDEHPPQNASWHLHDWERLTIEKVAVYEANVKSAIKLINSARSNPDDEFELMNTGVRGKTIETIE